MGQLTRFLAAATCCLLHYFSPAQTQVGLRTERQSGIWAAPVNPAHLAFSPQKWDLCLFSADIFFENTYGFARNTSVPHFLKNAGKVVLATDITSERPAPPGALVVDFFQDRRKMQANILARIAGPGFSIRIDDRNTIGVSTGLRAIGSVHKLPASLSFPTVEDFPKNEKLAVLPIKMAAMLWNETAFTYAVSNGGDGDYIWSLGLTAKWLNGFDGGFVNVNRDFDFTRFSNDSIQISGAKLQAGFTYANADRLVKGEGVQLEDNGQGFGFDFGFSIALPDVESGSERDYKWRLGLSVLDLGQMVFSQNAEQHRFKFGQPVVLPPGILAGQDAVRPAFRQFSRILMGKAASSLADDVFSIGLPSAVSIQADYKYAEGIYVGALLEQRVPFFQNAVRRPSTLALLPRLERRWLAVALPVALIDYRSLRMGLSARLGVLVVGSDNLTSYLKKKKLTGTDFYIGLKFNGFGSSRLRLGGGLSGKKRNWHSVGCFKF